MQSASDCRQRGTPLPRAAMGWLLGAALTALSLRAVASEVYVVCNAGISLQATDIRDVFVGDKSFAGTARLAPADNSAAQAAFLEKVMKLDARKYATLWTKKSFRDGANPPPVRATDAEAIAYVRATPGGCSYVLRAPAAGVIVIAKF
jgi:hypothetical protein